MLLLLDHVYLVLFGFKCMEFVIAKETYSEIKKKTYIGKLTICVNLGQKQQTNFIFCSKMCRSVRSNKTSLSSISGEIIIRQTYLLQDIYNRFKVKRSPEVTKEITEQVQSEEKGSKLFCSSLGLARGRQIKEQPKLEKKLTPFGI